MPADETRDPRLRPAYRRIAAALRDGTPGAVARGDVFEVPGGGLGPAEQPLPAMVDPVPRLFTATEWAGLAAGLAQRARVLDAVVADAYGARRAASAPQLPADLASSSHYFEPDMAAAPAPPVSAAVVGFDVVRDAEGRLRVLEDNLRAPAFLGRLAHLRRAVERGLPEAPVPAPVEGPVRALLRGMLAHAGAGGDDAAILVDHPGAAHWELGWLAQALGVPLVAPGDLAWDGRRLRLRADGRALAVLWQRTGEDRLRRQDGRLTAIGDALLSAVAAGAVTVLNRPGCGVADDKRTYAHLPALARLLLGEELALPSLATLDLADPEARARAFAAPERLVFKPRAGGGGRGIVVGATASAAELDALRARVGADPASWVAQEHVELSTHPVATEAGRFEPRRVDLRAFAVRTPAGYEVVPGGVARFALAEAGDVVNASAGGGIKDVWVLPGA